MRTCIRCRCSSHAMGGALVVRRSNSVTHGQRSLFSILANKETTMNKLIITTLALGIICNLSIAYAVEATQTVIAQAEQVCAANFVLSEKAMTTCSTKTWPRIVKAGDKFFNTGVGAEFNTLIRQLPKATTTN